MEQTATYQTIRQVSGMICILVLLGLFIGEALGIFYFPDRTVYVIVGLIGALLGLDQFVADTVFQNRRGGGPGGRGGDP